MDPCTLVVGLADTFTVAVTEIMKVVAWGIAGVSIFVSAAVAVPISLLVFSSSDVRRGESASDASVIRTAASTAARARGRRSATRPLAGALAFALGILRRAVTRSRFAAAVGRKGTGRVQEGRRPQRGRPSVAWATLVRWGQTAAFFFAVAGTVACGGAGPRIPSVGKLPAPAQTLASELTSPAPAEASPAPAEAKPGEGWERGPEPGLWTKVIAGTTWTLKNHQLCRSSASSSTSFSELARLAADARLQILGQGLNASAAGLHQVEETAKAIEHAEQVQLLDEVTYKSCENRQNAVPEESAEAADLRHLKESVAKALEGTVDALEKMIEKLLEVDSHLLAMQEATASLVEPLLKTAQKSELAKKIDTESKAVATGLSDVRGKLVSVPESDAGAEASAPSVAQPVSSL